MLIHVKSNDVSIGIYYYILFMKSQIELLAGFYMILYDTLLCLAIPIII